MEKWFLGIMAIGISVFLVELWDWWEKRRAKEHMLDRQPLTEDEFGVRFFSPDRSLIASRMRRILADHVPMDLSRLHPDDKLLEDVRMEAIDSLSSVEFILDVEKEFGIPIPDSAAQQLRTLRDFVDYVATHS